MKKLNSTKSLKNRLGKSLSFTLLVSAIAAAAASLSHAAPIIGGEEVSKNDPVAETTVGLVLNLGNGNIATCTGSLIAMDLVVTAAHCLNGPLDQPLTPANIRIIFGTNLRDRTTVMRVAQATGAMINPKYQGTHGPENDESDIGLIRFGGGLPVGYAVAALLPRVAQLQPGELVELAGFGISDARADAGAGVLRKVEVQIATLQVSPTEIAVDQRHGKGACHGDSGGPAFVTLGSQHYLFGVTSRGVTGDKFCDTFGVYTLINSHLGFIQSATAKLRSSNSFH